MTMYRKAQSGLLGVVLALAVAQTAAAQAPEPPAQGVSARIDAIRSAGALRVGVIDGSPWLVEDTTGGGEQWSGPAWTLSKTYADLLGVKLEAVPVSHETKVPVLASNQVDITIAPLGHTPQRELVVDFVMYSNSSLCMVGKGDNPKLEGVTSVDELNEPEITIAFFTGGAEEHWVPERFPDAQHRAVSGSGSLIPMEEILSGRADVAPVVRVAWIDLQRKVPGLIAFPLEDNCQNSPERQVQVGMAIDKNQPEFLEWLRAVQATMEEQLRAEEIAIMENAAQ